MKIKQTLKLSIESITFGSAPKMVELIPISENVKRQELREESSFDMKGFNLSCDLDEDLSETEFEANMKLAQTVLTGLATAIPVMVKTVIDGQQTVINTSHQNRIEEMLLADKLEREKHERIQSSKSQPGLDAKIIEAVKAVNTDLVRELQKAVRGY